MSEESSDWEPVPTPLRELWERSYPFAYWDNRINKINPYNPQDQLEALFTLLHLSDTYVTILSAKLRNPYEPWLMVTDRTYKRDIDRTLGEFQVSVNGETYVDLGQFTGETGVIAGTLVHEEWKDQYGPVDHLAGNLLGCPVDIDTKNRKLTFLEDRDHYIDVCNAVVNFWRNHYQLLNDLKHGFRLLPFDWGTLELLMEQGLLRDDSIDIEEKRAEFERTKDDYVYFWRLEIDDPVDPEELEKMEPGDDLELGLRLITYRIEGQKCVQFSRVVLRLLHNLFGGGGGNYVLDMFAPLLEEDLVTLQMVESFIQGPIRYRLEPLGPD